MDATNMYASIPLHMTHTHTHTYLHTASPVQPEQPPVAPTFDRMGQVTPEVLALMKQHAAWLATEGVYV